MTKDKLSLLINNKKKILFYDYLLKTIETKKYLVRQNDERK